VEREAALALVFLAFSLSGTVIDRAAPAALPQPAGTSGGASSPECVVVIMGWLGSMNSEFGDLVQHYRSRYPRCTVLTTVGGSDRWAAAATPPADHSVAAAPAAGASA
jgi:hypothetical protein